MARFREQVLLQFHDMARKASARIRAERRRNPLYKSLVSSNNVERTRNPLLDADFGFPPDHPFSFSVSPCNAGQKETREAATRALDFATDGPVRPVGERGMTRGRRKLLRRSAVRGPEGAAAELAQNAGECERDVAFQQGGAVEERAMTRAGEHADSPLGDLLNFLQKVSLTSCLRYDSKSGESESSVAVRGPDWRAEIAGGDLLRRRGPRNQGSSPLWELHWMGLIMQQDMLLVPLHDSSSHGLWWGYNHKRDIHLARGVMKSKSRRWHAESVVTLKPFRCLLWNLRFPNGHYLWSPLHGSSASLFTTIGGGQLQVYGAEARRNVTFSYDKRLGEWGPTLRHALVFPEGVASVELHHVLATDNRGLFQRRKVDARIVRTASMRSKSTLLEVAYEPNDWLRLSCGASIGRQSLSFASLAIGQSQRTADPRGTRGALSGAPALRIRVEVPPVNIRRSTFTLEWNHSFDVGTALGQGLF
eukprot:TRINITY_DN4260_c0_g3_i1.p1 TRINITY_DN4260_c0_g3~~TRINITY_DN4260_c0_g3_i1.p1  ORF type:complete len:543 (+),score=59.81 TRINITY_DN4260_c0_g3_i1:200-1630(+)